MSPEVHAAITAQEARRPQSEARAAACARLGEPGTVAVVTGQQVGLALGPLYTLHKAVAAVVTARALEAETGRPAVPVFWLQTEDHDVEEISAVGLPDAASGEVRRIALAAESARVSVSERRLGAGIDAVHAALNDALTGLQRGEETLALLRRHYRSEATFAEAFAGVMAELFAEAGLVLVDPRDPALGAACAAVHRKALAEARPLAEVLEARAAALSDAGFDVQVPIRPDAALSCFHPDGAGGPRYRLVTADDAWELAGRDERVGAEAVTDALQKTPLAFSTTALLRPALQDVLLPTAAYVGGPGELAYFSELDPVYRIFERPMPLAVPRARFVIAGPTVRRLAEQLEVSPLDAGVAREELLAALSEREGDAAIDVGAVLAPVREAMARAQRTLEAAVTPLDAGFERVARKVEAVVGQQLERLAGRAERALAEADEVRVSRVDRLQGLCWPDGAPQERVYGFPWFAAQHGPRELVDALLAAATPWNPELVEVSPP